MRKISTSDNQSNDPVAILNEHFSPVTAACFIVIDGKEFLVTGSLNGDVFVNDLNACRAVSKMIATHSNKVVSLQALSSNIYPFLSQGRDGIINIYKSISDKNLEPKFESFLLTNCSQFCLTPVALIDLVDSVLVALPISDAEHLVSVRYINLESKASFESDAIHQQKSEKRNLVTSLKLSHSLFSNYLFVADDASTLQCYALSFDVETKGIVVKAIDFLHNIFDSEPINCIEFDLNKYEGVLGSSSDQLVIFKLTETNLIQTNSIKLANPGTSCIALRGDYKLCVASGWDHRIRIFKWPAMKPLKVLYFHNDTIDCITYSRKNLSEKHYFAVCCADGLVTIWDFYNYKVV
ncbi:hypothetical protein B4U80_13101 [Leptotrombidium deliense]|uniref:Uncharacterized protein n=1 Tax=Leptotrombidium deliense TaxID=299467 RepID=A0A443SCR5_9ACAR|nr:hypothetical protein B4U80_13101 [Leptotrombidium deliense]